MVRLNFKDIGFKVHRGGGANRLNTDCSKVDAPSAWHHAGFCSSNLSFQDWGSVSAWALPLAQEVWVSFGFIAGQWFS